MNLAICFWGLNRSIEYTIESLEANIFTPLRQAGINYSIFAHMMTLTRPYTNPRADEHNVFLKQTTWKHLPTEHSIVENQDTVDKTLQLKQYTSQPDPYSQDISDGYTPYTSVFNSIRALYSMDYVTRLWETSGQQFDAVVYVRPDVRLLSRLQPEWFEHLMPNTVYCPNFHLIDNCNDRFAFGIPKVMSIYGHRISGALNYSKHFPFHSERFLAHTMKQSSISIQHVPIAFLRVRAGGKVHKEDMNII